MVAVIFFRLAPGLYGIFMKKVSVFIHSPWQNATRNLAGYLLNFRDILLIPCESRIKIHVRERKQS